MPTTFNLDAFSRLFANLDPLRLLETVIIGIGGFLALRLVVLLVSRVFLRSQSAQTKMIWTKLISYLGATFIIAMMFAHMGMSLSAIMGTAGVLGIAVGIASQKSLGNVISGFFIVSEQAFKIGDIIKVGDQLGVVHAIDMLSIKLKTFDNLLIRIPNETLVSENLVNITQFPIRRMDLLIGVDSRVRIAEVRTFLETTAAENTLVLNAPPPFFVVRDADEKGLLLQFGVWFENANYADVRNSLYESIQNGFAERGWNLGQALRIRTVEGPTMEDPAKTSPSA